MKNSYILMVSFILSTCVICNNSFVLINDFYINSNLNHGVHELLIHVKGIRSKQTVAGPKEGTERGIVVRQLSNGKQVVNLVYNGIPPYLRDVEGFHYNTDADPSLIDTDEDGLSLKECKVDKGTKEVEDFLKNFDAVSRELQIMSQFNNNISSVVNTSYVSLHRPLHNNKLPLHLAPLTSFRNLKYKCFKLNRRIRKNIKKLNNEKTRSKLHFNSTSTSPLSRPRRGVTNLLSIPNTKWCGKGYSAKSYQELGGLYSADNCCRQHDLHCPFFIRSFERKYGYFHYGLGTISHCSCDKRFKTCLKQTGTGASDVVGNVFFNIVKSNCFVFKKKKVCKKRGFWSCLKWGFEKQAVIRNPIPWNL